MNTKMGAEIYISLTGLVWFKLCSNGYTKDNRLNHKVSTTEWSVTILMNFYSITV